MKAGEPPEPAARPVRPSRARRRRLAILLALAVALAFLVLAWFRAPSLVAPEIARRVERALEEATGCEAHVGGVRARLARGTVELSGVTLTCDGAEVAAVPRLRARLSAWSLLRGRAEVALVEVESPVLRIDASDLPWRRDEPGSKGAGSFTLGRVVVTDADVEIRRLPRDVTLHVRRARATASGGLDRLKIEVTSPDAAGSMGALAVAGASLEARGTWTGGGVSGADVRLSVPELGVIEAGGNLSAPGGALDGSGRLAVTVRPEAVARLVGRLDPPVTGEVRVEGEWELLRSVVAFTGTASSSELIVRLPGAAADGSPRGVRLQAVSASVDADATSLELSDLAAKAFEGDLSGRVRARRGPAGFVIELQGELAGASSDALASLGPPGVLPARLASVSVSAHGAFPLDDPAAASGGFELALQPDPRAAPPLLGPSRLAGRIGARAIHVTQSDLRPAGAHVAATGRVGFDGTVEGRVAVDVPDLATTFARLGAAIPGLRPLLRHQWSGEASWGGVVAGTLRRPTVDGRLAAVDVAVGSIPVGTVDARVAFHESALRVEDARIEGALGRLQADLVAHPEPPQALTGTWRVEGVDLAALLVALGKPAVASGVAEGAGVLRLDDAGRPVADGSIAIARLELRGVTLGDFLFDGAAGRGGMRVRRASARAGEARLVASGDLPWSEGDGALAVSVEDLPIPLDRPDPWARVTGEATIGGSLAAPRPQSLRARVEGLPPVLPWTSLRIEGRADGDVVALRVAAEGADLSGDVRVGMRAPHDASADLRAGPLSLSLGQGEEPAQLGLDSLSLTASMRPGDWPSLTGTARADGVTLSAGSLRLSAPQAIRVVAEGREIRLLPARLDLAGGEGPLAVRAEEGAAGLDLSASARLGDEVAWSASLDGVLPARALQPASGGLSLSGVLDADVRAQGVGAKVSWSGRVELSDGHAKPVGQPHALEDLSALLTSDGRTVHLERATGLLGGGPVSATGHAEIEGASIARFALVARGSDVALRLPRDAELSTVSDFELAWAGTPEESRVTGQVELLQGTWRKDVRLGSSVLRRSVRRPDAAPRTPLDGVALDVRVFGEQGLFVDNDLARVELFADMQVRGTAAQPVLVGTAAALDEGRLTLRGVSYRLLAASAQFSPSRPNDPDLHAQAETSLNGVLVLLTLGGRLSDPRIDLASDPPMPRQRLLAMLLTGGGIGDEASGDAFDPAAGSRIGPLALRSQTALDVLHFDPFSEDGDGGRAARLTIGQRLTPRLFAAYSTFLSGSRESAAEVRYALNPAMALRLARESDGSVVIGVRYQRRGRGPSRPQEEGSTIAASVVVTGAPDPPGEDALRRALGLAEGDRVGPRALRRAARAARTRLRTGEHPLARVECVAQPVAGSRSAVTCTVRPGDRIGLRVEGLPKGPARRAVAAVRAAWTDVGAQDDLLPEAERAVQATMHEAGHSTASVSGEWSRDGDETTLTLAAVPGPVARIASVVVEGTDEVAGRDVEAAISAGGFGALRKPPLTPRRKEDARRFVEGTLVDRGYLEATVEDASVEPADGGDVRLVLRAAPGRRARVDDVVVEGATTVSAAEIEERFGIRAGDWLRPAELDAAARRAEDRLDALGRPDALVSWRAEPAGDGVAVRVLVEEGPASRVGRVLVEGARHVDESFVTDVAGLSGGVPLRRRDVQEAQARLSGLGIFRRVVVAMKPPSDDGTRDVVVRIEERDRVDLSAGAAWVSDEGPRLALKVGRRLLLGRALSAGVDLQAGDAERAEAFMGWRHVKGSPIDLLGTAGLREDVRRSFTARRRGLSLQATRPLSGRSEVRLRYLIEDIRLSDLDVSRLEAGLDDGLLASVGFSFTRDTRDDALDPQEGSLLSGDVVVGAKALGSEAGWAKAFLQHARTVRLARRWSYSAGVRLGVGTTLGDTELLPISERFFAGGTTSVRGYSRDALGPRDAQGTPLGGAAVLILNNDVRCRLTKRLSAVAFLDAGQAWATASGMSLSDLKVSAGPGLGVATPAGPVRVYWGFPLDGSDSGGRLHVTFGPIF